MFHYEVNWFNAFGGTVNAKSPLSRSMFYSNSIKQTILIFAIAMVLN